MYGEQIDEEVVEPERSFQHQSVWTRIPIVAAGPGFNYIFAVLLIALIHIAGVPVETSVQIGQVLEGSAAVQAGLQSGDVILAVDDKPVQRIHELKAAIMAAEGRSLHLQVQRGNEVRDLTVAPRRDSPAEEWRIGVELRPGEMVLERANPLAALGQGVAWTWRITELTFTGFGKIIAGTIPASESLAGPIGIAREIGRQADYGWRNVVFFTAAISVSLAILNLLPIPVLDGGHLLFFAIEIINGKPLSLRKREIAQQVGLLILVSLMLFAFYNDIMNMFVTK
jgi:regulator of sigma E protease